ncbi:hypothetical protein GTY75_05115 [Streptomyces sp. SID8381]|uniref:hypothetical protein n=1 Tax=unclassified Streptomyces TaxID=2593676 RepID=UPI0003637452|nr:MULTISPECIES: hypothetical protein [unclassified Streptomyces]MYX26053.1 hypothetical protein [Streptomyces sp. SID8381]
MAKTAADETVETVEVVPDAAAELAAGEAEARGEVIEVEHNGRTYTVPSPLDYPVDVVFADNDFEAVRIVLGEEQWQEYRKSKPTIRDFQLLNEKINKAAGN